MKLFKKITVLSLIFSSTPLLGHIYRLEKFEKDNNTIICMSDNHQSKIVENQINDKQREDIIEIAKGLSAFMILEDKQDLDQIGKKPSAKCKEIKEIMATSPLSFNPNNYVYPRSTLRIIEKEKAFTALDGLSSLCYYNNIPYKNIDFRTISELSLSGDYGLCVKHAIAKNEQIKNEIRNYDDAELKPYYKDVIEFNKKNLEKARPYFDHLQKNGDLPFFMIPKQDHAGTIEALNNFSLRIHGEIIVTTNPGLALFTIYPSVFIDARILHAVHTVFAEDKKNTICICAGGGHIRRITPVLEQMGWKKIIDEGEKSLTSMKEPKALNLQELETRLLPKNFLLKLGIKRRIMNHVINEPQLYAPNILASMKRS